MQNVAEVQDTPARKGSLAPGGLGVCWTDQEVPFHASASVTCAPARLVRDPTATHAVGEVHETAARLPSLIRGLGVGCTAQAAERAATWADRADAAAGAAPSPADGTVAAPADGTAT